MWFLTLLLLIFILGIIILVHEFGHFICAKKFGVYIYEFSIGMGPIIHTHKGKKDGIDYNIRAFPIGGFVSMAGEVYEDDDTKKIPKEKFMCNKKWWQRLIILSAGVINNFILAIIVLFVMALIWGATSLEPKVAEVVENYPVAESGIEAGDTILEINGHKVSTWDEAQIVLNYKNKNDYYTFKIEHEDGKVESYKITPKVTKDEEGNETKTFGFRIAQEKSHGLWASIKYSFTRFGSLFKTLCMTVGALFTGKIGISSLSGPVGIYHVVGESMKVGAEQVIYLLAYLSLNVGIINILPIPAFDGGRILFLIIEKIKGSPVNAKFENICHQIFFILLIILIIYITVIDIIRFA